MTEPAQTIDPTKIIVKWLDAFAAALQTKDASRIENLFCPAAHWCDVLGLGWAFATVSAALLVGQLGRKRATVQMDDPDVRVAIVVFLDPLDQSGGNVLAAALHDERHVRVGCAFQCQQRIAPADCECARDYSQRCLERTKHESSSNILMVIYCHRELVMYRARSYRRKIFCYPVSSAYLFHLEPH